MKLPAILNEKLLSRAMLGVGVYFAIVKPLLVKFNIVDTKEEKAAKQKVEASKLATESGASDSPYSWAAFFSKAPKDVLFMNNASATQFAKTIHDSYNGWNWFTSLNDSEKVLGVLSAMKTQSQFSWVCKKFFEMYSTSMLEYLKQMFSEQGLSEFNLKLVQKPKYKVG